MLLISSGEEKKKTVFKIKWKNTKPLFKTILCTSFKLNKELKISH